jgi:hypothetical protein
MSDSTTQLKQTQKMTAPTLEARKASGTIVEFYPSLGTGFIQRQTAFTYRKALQEHIDNKHSMKKEKEVKAISATKISPSKPKRKPPSRHTINLPAHTPATIGRFIGKQGANLKVIETKYRVKIFVVTKPQSKSCFLSSSPHLQVKIRAIDSLHVSDLDKVTESLKKAWQRAIREQEEHISHRESQIMDDDSDEIEFPPRKRAINVKKKFQQRRWRLTKLRSASSHSARSLEGHRCAISTAGDSKAKKTSDTRAGMKEKQRMLREQWRDDDV